MKKPEQAKHKVGRPPKGAPERIAAPVKSVIEFVLRTRKPAAT